MEETHIVALTAYSGKSVQDTCLSLGIKKLISKPIDFKQLFEVMWMNFYRV